MLNINNQGNIVSPNGATLLYGSQIIDEDNISIADENMVLEPYEILIVDEDDDDTIPADNVTYEAVSGSEITGTNLAVVIPKLESLKVSKNGDTMTGALILSGDDPTEENEAVTKKYVDNSTPVFSQQMFTATAGQTQFTLSNSLPSNAMMVFYNGLLINLNTHYTYSNSIITLSGYSAEANDIITVIGLAAPGMGG